MGEPVEQQQQQHPPESEPNPAESAPVEPEKVEPAPVEPEKVEPAPVEPAPVAPETVEPASGDPKSAEPKNEPEEPLPPSDQSENAPPAVIDEEKKDENQPQHQQQQQQSSDSSESDQSAIVTGATGATGKWMVKELVESNAFKTVGAVVRKAKENPQEFWEIDESKVNKLKQIVVDFNHLDEHKEDFQGYSHGFCLLGTTRKAAGSADAFRLVDHDYVVNSAKLMKGGGVKHFSLMTSEGAKANSWFLYPQTKGMAEESCKEIGFDKLSIFRPGFLNGRNDSERTGERFLSKIIPSRFCVHVKQVAASMRANAVKPRSPEDPIETIQNAEILAWDTIAKEDKEE